MRRDEVRPVLRRSLVAGVVAVVVVCAYIGNRWHATAEDVASSEPKPDRRGAALHTAVEKNLAYCRDWLAAKDWKSLRQTADGVGILAQVLRQQRDDEAWRRAADGLAADVQSLRMATDGERADACKDLIG